MSTWQEDALLCSFFATLFDIHGGKIPNALFPAFMAKMICDCIFLQEGLRLIRFTVLAGMILICLFPLFRFRMMGAGDIKLLACIGGCIGFRQALEFLFATFLCGAGIAILFICSGIGLFGRLKKVFHYFENAKDIRDFPAYMEAWQEIGSFHFTIPIFMSVLLWVGGVY